MSGRTGSSGRSGSEVPTGPRRAAAREIALAPSEATGIGAASQALPDPDTLEPGSMVLVLPELREEPSIARSVLALLGRPRTVPRVIRCSALVARGYVNVSAGTDPVTRADLVWGYAPTAPC